MDDLVNQVLNAQYDFLHRRGRWPDTVILGKIEIALLKIYQEQAMFSIVGVIGEDATLCNMYILPHPFETYFAVSCNRW